MAASLGHDDKGAEEEIEQERTNNVELANDMNDLRWQLLEAETQLREWDDWYELGVFAPTEEKGEGEEKETGAATFAVAKPSSPPAPRASYYSRSSTQSCFVFQTVALCQFTCSLC